MGEAATWSGLGNNVPHSWGLARQILYITKHQIGYGVVVLVSINNILISPRNVSLFRGCYVLVGDM